MIDKELLEEERDASLTRLESIQKYGTQSPGFNQELGWHDCLQYLIGLEEEEAS